MNKFLFAASVFCAAISTASAADMVQPYAKAPPMIPVTNWTGFYLGAGAGYGLWNADQHNSTPLPSLDFRTAGRGFFGTASGGYDWQLSPSWVVGLFGDVQFGSLKGAFVHESFQSSLDTKNDLNYAAGVRLGYLVAPDALTYVNGGYSHANFTGGTLSRSSSVTAGDTQFDGWFVGGGLENSLNFYGINAPGWFVKTEYRFAQYDDKRLNTPSVFSGLMIKPSEQTVSTQLVYRFNSVGTASAPYAKAPATPVNWTGFYLAGGGGYGMFDADAYSSQILGGQEHYHAGGHGFFGTVSGGYDWQIAPKWLVGLFGDAQFGDIKGNLLVLDRLEGGILKNNLNYAAGVRLGYLVAPNVLTYVNAGYSHADFKSVALVDSDTGAPGSGSLAAFHRDGYFVGSGFENSLNLLGINAPGWFMKSEYRLAVYDRVSLPVPTGGGLFNLKPYVQTISTSLVYRFN